MISDLEYKQEVMEDEGEETQLATDLSLERLETEISKLEAALNMTVSHWAELKTGHTEFAKKTLNILSNLMELAHTQSTTQPTQNTIDSIEARQQDESSTTSPVKYSNYTNVVKFPPSEISCEASSEFHKRFSCQKAFDGHLSVGGCVKFCPLLRTYGIGTDDTTTAIVIYLISYLKNMYII